MNKQAALLTLFFLLLLPGCTIYDLPDEKMFSHEICGDWRCRPGNLGTVLEFNKTPFSPDVDELTTPKEVAASVLGHTIKKDDKSGSIYLSCSEDGSNPFTYEDIKPSGRYGYGGRKLSYSKKSKIKLDTKLAVENSIKSIEQLLPANEKAILTGILPDFEVQLKSELSNLSNKNVQVDATYHEWKLATSTINKLRTTAYDKCHEYLAKYERKLITAVGFVHYSIDEESTTFTGFTSKVNSLLKNNGIHTDVSAAFGFEFNKYLSVSTEDGYQIIVWRTSLPEVWSN